ncbi:YfaZ family outer membrane protein [Sideroxydans lithotrophicus]|uniref:YfaZ family protein n=1 Tax=Sideroxydans lithotrophicus (strain ES-1) TaxID=580332 RepID=D5CLS7_SIDLE|nr:YfaZ family outer membrane protein [Sideroxydans lithotrophicus]ADE12522.1 YfaZ family protein [Sideroxydans lithotrophicus ES-1]
MLRKILAISLMSVATFATADTLDIGLSNTTAQFKYGVPSTLAGKSEMYAEFMYNDKNSIIGGVGLLVANDELQVPGLTIGIGAKAVAATIKELPVRKNVSAVALGAQVRYELPADRRVAFAGEFYYGPEIIAFGDAKQYQQYGARAEFSISPQMQVYAGYRKTQFTVKTTNTDVALINGPHIGVQFSF